MVDCHGRVSDLWKSLLSVPPPRAGDLYKVLSPPTDNTPISLHFSVISARSQSSDYQARPPNMTLCPREYAFAEVRQESNLLLYGLPSAELSNDLQSFVKHLRESNVLTTRCVVILRWEVRLLVSAKPFSVAPLRLVYDD